MVRLELGIEIAALFGMAAFRTGGPESIIIATFYVIKPNATS